MPYTPPNQSRDDLIQDGVHFRPGETPPDLWRLVTLDTVDGSSRADVAFAIDRIWELLSQLQAGDVPELAPEEGEPAAPVPPGALAFALGYGNSIFGKDAANGVEIIPRDQRPFGMRRLLSGAGRPFNALNWHPDADPAAGQRDFCLQLTADTTLALSRAIFEVSELIRVENLALQLKSVFDGFHRDDRRSWIGFHDGVNNLSREDRKASIIVGSSPDTPWLVGGCFLVFLRIAVDVAMWRQMSRSLQEALVGRAKLSGIPLTDISLGDSGEITVAAEPTCPFRPIGPLPMEDPMACVDPSKFTDAALQASHISRSNLLRKEAQIDANNRIYRQGYEFFEEVSTTDGVVPRVGLNFVAFVRRIGAVQDILKQSRWLGDANFGGGAAGLPSPNILSVLAGGYYALPSITQDGRAPGVDDLLNDLVG